MGNSDLRIDALTPAIGANITAIDISQPIDGDTLDAIYQALIDHLVIIFPEQTILPAAHLAFAESFGELDQPHHVYPHVPGFERIVLLENDADRPPETNAWHTDLTFKQNPPFASILYARAVPVTGGDTLWASMYAAYDALPSGMKEQLAGLSAVHDMGSFRNQYLARENGVQALNEAMAKVGSAVHPMVRNHPVTGRGFLFVNQSFTTHVVGMSSHESHRLLRYLFDHINQPEFQCRLRWQANSLVMWDNRVTQHYAVADYMPHYRLMHRVTVIDDRRA
jgi:taurine dioxygenase